MTPTPIDTGKKRRGPLARAVGYGFSPIPDSLLQWYRDMTMADMAVYHTIVHHTAKVRRQERAITRTQFMNETGLSRATVTRSIARLEVLGLILVRRGQRQTSIYRINLKTRPAGEGNS